MSPPQPKEAVPGRAAGIDYGHVRIESPSSHPTEDCRPLDYTRRGLEPDAQRFRRLVAEEGVVLFVVGLPLHMDGRESAKSAEARQFGHWLGTLTGVPVEFYDERLTSREAEQLLLDADLTRKRRKKRPTCWRPRSYLVRIWRGLGIRGQENRIWGTGLEGAKL